MNLIQNYEPFNSLEIIKKKGSETTLTDEEYISLAEKAANEVRRFCLNLNEWNFHSSRDGIDIFERKSDLSIASENMLMCITTLPFSMEKVEKLVSPWLPYRLKWDNMLENVETIKTWKNQEVYLVRHLVKKLFTISARESIDIVKVVRSENEVIFGSTGVCHKNYTKTKGYVRTHQFLGGYLLKPCDSNSKHTRFYMLFHADLNFGGPKLLLNVVAKFKPRLMCQKIDNLKKSINFVDV